MAIRNFKVKSMACIDVMDQLDSSASSGKDRPEALGLSCPGPLQEGRPKHERAVASLKSFSCWW